MIFFFLINTISITYTTSSILIIVYFFYVSWGLNYFRLPLERFISKEFVISEKNIENLAKLFSVQCNKLKQEINIIKSKYINYL